MKNQALEELQALVGTWNLTMSNAWFVDDPDFKGTGSATVEWVGDAFLHLHATLGADESTWDWVIGRSDPNEQLVMLYHDERGVCRVFDMTYRDGEWKLLREDPDFHQRFIATVETDRIMSRWEASEDGGATWRKDFDLLFERS